MILLTADRHKSRLVAVFEIGPTRTMPQIIIGPETEGKPAFNRPYDCVLIMEGILDVSAHIHTHLSNGRSVDYILPAARTNAYFSRNDPIDINSAILRAALDLTSRFSIVRCAMMHIRVSQI